MFQVKIIFCLKVIRVLVQGPFCNETESFQVLFYKNRKHFSLEYVSPGGRRVLPEGVFRKKFKKKKKLTKRSHPSGLKTETECWRPRAAVVDGGDPR